MTELTTELTTEPIAEFDWSEVLTVVADRGDLTSAQAKTAMTEVLEGRATSAQLAGFIVGLRVKGESVDEMLGMVEAMFGASTPLNLPSEAVDIVGTGGSAHRRKHALNISTMACFVAAAAGATVCKHGNYKASSTSGSFNFLESIGVRTDLTPQELEACVAEAGIGFALARTFHPAMRHAGPARAELGIPTVINVLGPMSHPGRVKRQVIGTPDPEMGDRMAQVMSRVGSDLVWVVSGADGLDELSTTGPNIVRIVTPGQVDRIEIAPEDAGLAQISGLDQLVGGSEADNAVLFQQMLDGQEGPVTEIVLFNAAAALVVAGRVDDLSSAVQSCRQALTNGLVAAKLQQLKTSISS